MDPVAALAAGQFVAEAYAMYDAEPTNLTPPKTNGFPAGHELTAWISMADFFGDTSDRVFYGFVATSRATPAAAVVALRGTQGAIEWWDDLHFGLVPFAQNAASGKVADGFDSIYKTLRVTPAGEPFDAKLTSGSFAQDVRRALTLVGFAEKAPLPALVATGHSLGSALITLYVLDNAAKYPENRPTVYTFASPRVGDARFVSSFDALALTSYRLANVPDLVPYLPPEILGFGHVAELQQIDSTWSARWTLSCAHALNTYSTFSTHLPSRSPRRANRSSGSRRQRAPSSQPPRGRRLSALRLRRRSGFSAGTPPARNSPTRRAESVRPQR
ncbi:MAG: lipase family protein [Vulcanimicrobiaceae bacterium]